MTKDGVAPDAMPDGFWALSETALKKETALQFMGTDISARLRAENPSADMLEMMLVERVAFFYVYMRQQECAEFFVPGPRYKEILNSWTGLAAELRKCRTMSLETMKDAILLAVSSAIAQAVQDLPEDQRTLIGERIAASFEEAGL